MCSKDTVHTEKGIPIQHEHGNQNQQSRQPGAPPDVEKTFIEGPDTPFSSARGATFTGGIDSLTNPYGKQQQRGREGALPLNAPGTKLGSGTITGELGAGGMARVYRIWNEQLEVNRAVKVLLPGQHSDLRARFETEAKITAKLHHPNIVEIHAVGEFDGLPFLEMEYIEGRTLETVIADHGRLPLSVCSSVAINIARALAYAHAQKYQLYSKSYTGVIHRDLKPANIMLSSNGTVKLMDFGIARPTEASLHTVDGNIVGTLQYLSPEQLDGVNIDGRTDIYSFGCILYEMLTGTKTFPQSTLTALVKTKAINQYRTFSGFEFSIHPALAKIAQKCLNSAPEKRYSNADELLADLRAAHISFCPIPPDKVLAAFSTDPSSIGGLERSARKFPVMAVGIGAGAVVVAGAVALALLLLKPNEPQATQNSRSAEEQQSVMEPQYAMTPQSLPDPQPSQATQAIHSSSPKAVPFAESQEYVRQPEQTEEKVQSRPRPVQPRPVTKKQIVELTPLQTLEKEYGSSDMLFIARQAMNKGRYTDVVTAAETIERSDIRYQKAAILMLEALLHQGKTSQAAQVSGTITGQDGYLYFLQGYLAQQQKKQLLALDLYDKALITPSEMRSTLELRKDALYYTARLRSDHYQTSPSPETRLQAQNAWTVVKRMYSAAPDHSRFKEANQVMAQMQ